MAAGDFCPDEDGVSELTSVLTLVAFAFVIVLAIGASVLFFQPQPSHPEASFTFKYYDSSSTLLITHNGGDPIRAGDLLIRGPQAQATWAETNGNINASTMINFNDVTQIGRQNAYGERVGESDNIAIVYVNDTTNTTAVLSQWNGTSI